MLDNTTSNKTYVEAIFNELCLDLIKKNIDFIILAILSILPSKFYCIEKMKTFTIELNRT